jgi:hypothetical protein
MLNKREISGQIFIKVLGRLGRASRLLQASVMMKCRQKYSVKCLNHVVQPHFFLSLLPQSWLLLEVKYKLRNRTF